MDSTLGVYIAMFRQWIEIATGTSYQHVDQKVGRKFKAGEIAGYFNDLTHKTNWKGHVTEDGIPIAYEVDGEMVMPPILIFQKGLGHWDTWLLEGNEAHLSHFLRIADWARSRQDVNGGWPLRPSLQKRLASPYSAMAQGEAASLLVRAYKQTGDDEYLHAALKASDLLLRPIQNRGVCRTSENALVFEEYPMSPPSTVLNGWIFALFGLYDISIATGEEYFSQRLLCAVSSLEEMMPQYDCGYWSLYDTAGNIASPFYHSLHIEQLKALYVAFPAYKGFVDSLERFEEYRASYTRRIRAILVKVSQRLNRPVRVIK